LRPARAALGAYLALLAASCVARHVPAPRAPAAPTGGEPTVRLAVVDGDRILSRTVRVAYTDSDPEGKTGRPAVILVHGSPGKAFDFLNVAPGLAARYRVIAPDLPGFGASEHDVPDYSFRAHARYVLELMDALGVAHAHVVGFSMGGGVVLSMADLAPRRVDSIVLQSAIGVQEMELLGDHDLNHVLHGLQLAGLWMLRELTPHFGWLDDAELGVPYARNFFDSDQRPLRGILARWQKPMLIVHGEHDPLVPIAAAREHARLVPQSALIETRESHFMVFQEGAWVAATIGSFLDKVEAGTAPTRTDATPERIAAAARPFDPRHLPLLTGFPWLVVLLLLAAATLLSEDLSCIVAGLLVAAHRIGYGPASVACFVGIFAGDLLLFLSGRVLGRAALRRAPLKWMITESQIRASSAWFRESGGIAILASRFLPGTRLPTYVAAGVLRTPFLRFLIWFAVAAAAWTPLLVGIASLVGAPFLGLFARFRMWALPAAIGTVVVVLFVVRVVPNLFSWSGRRQLVGAYRRTVRWEFWPPWVFYPPVVIWVLWQGIRHRHLTVFTAANPGIEGGGFIAESKASILRGLAGAGDSIPAWMLLPAAGTPPERVDAIRSFAAEHHLDFPMVLKPDAGQRGSGVLIARTWEEIAAHIEQAPEPLLVQEYVPGVEFGVFYARRPSEPSGRVFSVTAKAFPEVTGDGASTLERLILADRRAVALAPIYVAVNRARQHEIVPAGERVRLVEIGTHCRGAIFGDGRPLITPALEEAIDRVSRAFDGFYFGRYDVRSPSVDAFRRGEFRVIELNGVTSEATAIYDAQNGLLAAYRMLFRQWTLAFEIGDENRGRGVKPFGIAALGRLIARYRAVASVRPD